MPNSDIILTASGVEVACGEKLPRLDIVAYNGGLMSVPGWSALAIDLAGLDLAGQVRVLADHDATLDGILGHGTAETRDGKLRVSGAISATTDTARRVVELAKNGFEFQASVGAKTADLKTQIAEVERQLGGAGVVTEETGRLALSVYDFSQHLVEIWRRSNFASRRTILECVSSNLVLTDTSLVLAKRSPFDYLAERRFLKHGRGGGI